MSGNKINLKDKVSDGEIDLSLCELNEVPVKEIAAIRNVFSLDLSTNHLVKIPNNFVTLTHLTKLDLSKNNIRILPEDFGNLTKLKYLDLYKNELEFLPISFHKLKALRWLDLKDNPLAPSILSIAGPCLDAKECQRCATEIVKFYSEFEQNLSTELKKREEQRQLAKHAKEQAEQKQKHQEKKNKRKEKKVKGSEVVSEPVLHTIQDKCVATNEKAKTIVTAKQTSLLQSLLCTLVTIFLLSSSLFIVTSIKFQRIQEFNSYVANIWFNCIHSLPPNMQEYLLIFGEQFHEYHVKTGDRVSNITNFMNNAISNDDTIIPQLKHIGRIILENFVYYKNQLYEKINYFYMKYVL